MNQTSFLDDVQKIYETQANASKRSIELNIAHFKELLELAQRQSTLIEALREENSNGFQLLEKAVNEDEAAQRIFARFHAMKEARQ